MVVENSNAAPLPSVAKSRGAPEADSARTVPASRERLVDPLPKFFDQQQYRTVCALCEAIIPQDEDFEGAVEAGAPEFIDLLASENQRIATTLSRGLHCVDEVCISRHGVRYLECTAAQRSDILKIIAYRRNAEHNPMLRPGIEGFALLRRLTVGAFFTSRIGMDCLNYIGNTYLEKFSGCPVPAGWPGSFAAQPQKNGGEHG